MKQTILFITILLLSAGMGKAQELWSLQKCIDYALENNIQIKQQELNSEYNSNLVSQAKSNRLPNLNAQIGNNYSYGRSLNINNAYEDVNSTSLSGGISTNVTLWNGSQLKNAIVQRELDLEATLQELQKAKDDLTLYIASSYLEILFAEELVLVSEGQIEVTKQQINRTQQLVDAGSLAKGALLEIEAQLAGEELQLVNNQNSVDLAYLNLYQFLELPISESFKIEKPVLPEIGAYSNSINSLDIFNNALTFRPEVKSAVKRVESAKTQLEIAKGALYPSLALGANYNNNYFKILNTDSPQLSFGDQLKGNGRYGFGFSLNIPIFNKFQVRNSISNSTIQVMDYEYQLQNTKNVLRKDIETAYTNAFAALKKYISTEKAVTSMEEAFRYTEEKFNVGMVNSVEYNQSKNNLTNAQSNLLQAKYDYIFRTKILDFYNGIPIEL